MGGSLSLNVHVLLSMFLFKMVHILFYLNNVCTSNYYKDGMTPLLYATSSNNLDMMKLLLGAKAEVNVTNKVKKIKNKETTS
jgi:ankyrin repeat protein